MRAGSASIEMTGESSRELDSGGDSGGGERRAEVSRVEAGFVEEEKGFVAGLKSGRQGLGFGQGENASFGVGGGVSAGDGEDRGFGSERNFLAGELFYLSEIVRVERQAETGEFGELGGIFVGRWRRACRLRPMKIQPWHGRARGR